MKYRLLNWTLSVALIISGVFNVNLYMWSEEKNQACQQMIDIINERQTEPEVIEQTSKFEMTSQTYVNEMVRLSKTGVSLDDSQQAILAMAFDIGNENNLGLTMQGIVWQESLAGKWGRVGHMTQSVGKRSYGVAQVKLVAAYDVFRRIPELKFHGSEEELISALIYDDEYNIRIAMEYFMMMRKRFKNYRKALTAYNIGPGNAKKTHHTLVAYDDKVIKHFQKGVVKEFNEL